MACKRLWPKDFGWAHLRDAIWLQLVTVISSRCKLTMTLCTVTFAPLSFIILSVFSRSELEILLHSLESDRSFHPAIVNFDLSPVDDKFRDVHLMQVEVMSKYRTHNGAKSLPMTYCTNIFNSKGKMKLLGFGMIGRTMVRYDTPVLTSEFWKVRVYCVKYLKTSD